MTERAWEFNSGAPSCEDLGQTYFEMPLRCHEIGKKASKPAWTHRTKVLLRWEDHLLERIIFDYIKIEIRKRIMTRRFGSFDFEFVSFIRPDLDEDGNISEYGHPLPPGTQANEFGTGPFCKFALVSPPTESGSYIITVGEEAFYVGETGNLSRRFGLKDGYGYISVENCKKSGPSTNCKINSFILEVAKAGKKIRLWFYRTTEPWSIEKQLIEELNPAWNYEGKTTTLWNTNIQEAERAKREMVFDRRKGEQAFTDLLQNNPNDGMIYYKRGEAYEDLGEKKLAYNDFAKAEKLFPYPGRKKMAREAQDRVSQ